MEENKADFPWITVDKVNYHLRKINKDGATTTVNTTMVASSLAFSGLSSLTGEETSQGDSTYDPANADASMSDDSSTMGTGQSTMIENATGGRPKGSTVANSADLEKCIRLTKQEAAEAFSLVKSHAKKCKKRTTKGVLALIIINYKAKHNIPTETHISKETIRSRAKRGKFTGGIPGNTSPMVAIEPYIVELICQLAKIRVPIT